MKKPILLVIVLVLALDLACCEKRNKPDKCGKFAARIYYQLLIDDRGKILKMLHYDEVMQFSEGYAAVKNKEGKWGYIDRDGNEVISPRFGEAHPFSCGRAIVEIEFGDTTLYKIIDTKGDFIEFDKQIDDKYFVPSPIYYNGYLACILYNNICFLDVNGNIFVKTKASCNNRYDWFIDATFNEGYCVLSPNMIVDMKGNCEEYKLYIEDGTQVREGKILAIKDDKVGFINAKGEWVITPLYYNATCFSEGLAFVATMPHEEHMRIRDKRIAAQKDDIEYSDFYMYCNDFVCIDSKGSIVFKLQHDEDPYMYIGEYAIVRTPKGCYYINKEGKNAFNRLWYNVMPFENGLAWVRDTADDEYYLFSSEGRKMTGAVFQPTENSKNKCGYYETCSYKYISKRTISSRMLAYIEGSILIDPEKKFDITEYDSFEIEKTFSIVNAMPSYRYFVHKKGKYAWTTDSSFNEVMSPKELDYLEYSEERIICSDSECNKVVLDVFGKILVGDIDEIYGGYKNGYVFAYKNKRGRVLDKNGRYVSREYRYVLLGYGCSVVCVEQMYYMADEFGRILSNIPYSNILPICRNIYAILDEKEQHYIFINCKGNRIKDIKVDYVLPMVNGFFAFEINGLYGLLDMNLNSVVPAIYKDREFAYYCDGYVIVYTDQGTGVMRYDGTWAIPPMFFGYHFDLFWA